MRKVEAPTLEEAYAKASEVLECSISELQCEVVQHPSNGILGLLKKPAIIIAVRKSTSVHGIEEKQEETFLEASEAEIVATEIVAAVKDEAVKDKISIVKPEVKKDAVLESFFEPSSTTDDDISEEETIVYDELARMIEDQLKELFSHSCYEIDVVEVDVIDNTALIFIDGNDAALLIGKEGYRYNALSYMIFNWLHTKYELFIKLEIAEFLTTQQEMIRKTIQPVIENVEKQGKGKTRFLDGILVQIALEQLRERFPDKYVAVKTAREGKKFVVINEFNNTKTNAS
jgi:spoIIIJ-associated protein